MRLLLLLATLTTMTAGCASAPTNLTTASAPNEAPAADVAPWHSAGTVWLKPTQQDAGKLALPFVVNATRGATVTVKLHVGERYGPLELPAATSNEDLAIVDATGAVLAKASRGEGAPADVALEGTNAATGAGNVTISYHGGSDEGKGGGYGDYVTFMLDVR